MKDSRKVIQKHVEGANVKERFNFKRCGSITCIHNMGERCNLETCDMYERKLIQEY